MKVQVVAGWASLIGQNGPMSSDAVPRGLIVCLPVAEVDDYVGVIETLIQEGLHTFALPAESADLATVVEIFGARASFGAHRVRSAAQAAGCADSGAGFALIDLPDDEALAVALDRGMGAFVAAMTPAEVRAAYRSGATGALLYPADVVGHAMGHRLAELGLADRAIPLGAVGAYAAGEWLASGAPAVCIDSSLLGDAFDGGSLAQLRDRCGSFVTVQRSHESVAGN